MFRRPSIRGVTRWLFRWGEHALALAALLYLLFYLFFDLSVMFSSSMSPTLKGTSVMNGDWVVTEKISYWFRDPHRWEVITFINDDGTRVMKRVAGLPGESVTQSESYQPIEINGQKVEMPKSVDLKYLRYGNLMGDKPIQCGEGYYLLGDDTRDSEDSRFTGPLPRKRIVGRSWLIVWPLSRFGWVTN